ncbi:MAG: hypothetical protein IJN39_04295 [Clostridia bacterium]|nr:hypothetical protein [Clostridia bacterium]
MKKFLKILLIVILCVAIIVGFILYRNWNTVLGVIDGLRYSQEDVERMQQENKQELQNFLDDHQNVTVRDLTPEENEALANGEISQEDAIKIITGSVNLSDLKLDEPPDVSSSNPSSGDTSAVVTNQETQTPEQTTPTTTVTEPPAVPQIDPSKDSGQVLSELIATLYVQKSVYISKLDTLESTLGAEFEKVPKSEKKDEKARIISEYMPVIAEWEKTCDAVVYGILDQIEAELKKTGDDLTIIDKIDEAYQNEKRLKKAYYVNNYMS